jgi:hypothetical protein
VIFNQAEGHKQLQHFLSINASCGDVDDADDNEFKHHTQC